MSKSLRFTLVAVLLIAVLSACTPQPTPVYLPAGTDHNALEVTTLPFAQNIVDGIAQNDYVLFAHDFDATMLKSLDNNSFAQIVKIYGGNGPAKDITLINIEIRGEYYGLNYQVTYEKGIVIMTIVLPKAEPRLVSGLLFK
jgi:hypothetical protein